jgi:hypothetical protein
VAGFGFSGKTLPLQALALALAADRPVWGVYTGKARRVIHVDLEQGDALTRRRYQRLARAMKLDLASAGDALVVAVMPALSLAPQHVAKWRELLTGRDLCIIDSLRSATGGQDENSSDIRAALDMLGHLSEATGCRVTVIHHARKPSADEQAGRYAIRGSGAIYDAVDCAYVFTADKGEPVHAEHVKARSHGEPVDPWALVIGDVEIDGDPRAGLEVRVHGAELVAERRAAHAADRRRVQAAGDADAVRRAVTATPGAGTTALRGATGLSGDRFAAAVALLGTELEVLPERHGRTTIARHYLRGTP